jgi:glycosyltransferase involved in cell wall biosynthesis
MLNKATGLKFPFFLPSGFLLENAKQQETRSNLPEILFITSYPSKQSASGTYSQDLIAAMNKQFLNSFSLRVCALEYDQEQYTYFDDIVKYRLDINYSESYTELATSINSDEALKIVVLQHDFNLFSTHGSDLTNFLSEIKKPVIVAFHSVLPDPDDVSRDHIQHIARNVEQIIAFTNHAFALLVHDYKIDRNKIKLIAHGTHLVPHLDKNSLKEKYGFKDRRILSTFGFLRPQKSIETSLEALPEIIKTSPDVLFVIIGETHPLVIRADGENYRHQLQAKVAELKLSNHVKFINENLDLDELLEYLQLTDVYLFTSNDRHQTMSGSISYALSCGCPVVSTPIPHAVELLTDGAGLLFDFGDSAELADCVNKLLFDIHLRKEMTVMALHKTISTAWENSAVAHANLIQSLVPTIELQYRNTDVNLKHIKRLTTDFGILQSSNLNKPDLRSGYTIDDNARALIALCQYYKQTLDPSVLRYISTYLDFIEYCERRGMTFLKYVDINQKFTKQNNNTNLDDSSGHVIWALGYLVSLNSIMPAQLVDKAQTMIERTFSWIDALQSPQALAFSIKGLFYYNRAVPNENTAVLITNFANRLVQMYRHQTFILEQFNALFSEALLMASIVVENNVYRDVAKASFDQLLSDTFVEIDGKLQGAKGYEERPVNIANTVIALRRFHTVFADNYYLEKMQVAFNWFQGNNHLNQIIYNPCTGGCFDGIYGQKVNLNQGAESTLSYLMARMTVCKLLGSDNSTFTGRRSTRQKYNA